MLCLNNYFVIFQICANLIDEPTRDWHILGYYFNKKV